MKTESGNCIFYLLNTYSHYNSTFRVSTELKQRGYNPIYVGDRRMRKIVEDRGFMFCSYSIRSFCINEGLFQENDDERAADREDLVNYKNYFVKGGYFDDIIERFHPEVVFLDVSKIGFFPDLYCKNLRLALICTKVNLNKEPFIPPFTSGFVPFRRDFFTKFVCEFLWYKVLILKRLLLYVTKIRNHGFSLNDLPLQYIVKNGVKHLFSHINNARVSNFGLDNVPEIILSPEEFDFSGRCKKVNQIYLGPSIDVGRKEILDDNVAEFLNRRNCVYCCMGSYDRKYRDVRTDFIDKVIHAFAREKENNLVVSLGGDAHFNSSIQLPENILVREHLSQLEILKHCSIMITHGGMQSITEAILCGVPLLVYPLNPWLDQRGNAARVRFHNVGLVGNIRTATPKTILRNVKRLMVSKEITDSTKHLREKYLNSSNFRSGMKLIEDYIKS